MKLDLFQINAFTDKLFTGNPACVIPLKEWLDDQLLLKIAKENAVAETAFFIEAENEFYLRWFTPEIEMDLCGHATLATAHALKAILNYTQPEFVFHTRSGKLIVTAKNQLYSLYFPSRKPVRTELPEVIKSAIDLQPSEVLRARDYLLVYHSENDVRTIKIDRHTIDKINLDPGGIIITAKGDECDFVSRFFTPQASIFEDPVTGSAHCSLIPYWSKKLNKTKMLACQISDRFGKLYCENKADGVIISGNAITYFIGSLWTE